MISVEQALEYVLAESICLSARSVPLQESLGLILAEDAHADLDSPAADKSLVDGYAIIAEDFIGGLREFRVLEQVTAGAVPTLALSEGAATQIMTGAPIPEGASAVVMVEQTEKVGGSHAPLIQIRSPRLTVGQNIMPRGLSIRRGQQVLAAGQRIRGIEIGLLAEIGKSEVSAVPRPTVAVVSTGNELVNANAVPGPGQLRNSNGPMLAALAAEANAVAAFSKVARDDEAELRETISQGLACDVLVLSGGVSAGVLDLVPKVLNELGVRPVFHKVHLKPGKPIWFGVANSAGRRTLVFGLPGNPVSSLVCFVLFVRPALYALAGDARRDSSPVEASLATPFQHRGDRPTYFPGRLAPTAPELRVQLLNWQGSADLRTLAEANCLVHFPPGDKTFAANELVPVIRL